MKAKCLSKAQQRDLITTLPQAIVETILCLLPIEEAARTSILSREWRYKWTKIPKLVFLQSTVKEPSEECHLPDQMKTQKMICLEEKRRHEETRCKLFCAIHQVLLQRQGPIHEFTLSMEADKTCFEIDQIILHLSRNHTVKKLTLAIKEARFCREYGLPLSVFSSRHLADLYLEYCIVALKPVSNGLGSLTSLTLKDVWIFRETLLHLLSSCPSLKRLCIMIENHVHEDENPNTIAELFKCLPLIEHLTTWGYITKLVRDWVLLPSLIHLKYFCIEQLGFGPGNGFAFLGALFKCSPNLEKIKLVIETHDAYDVIESTHWEEEYSAILKKYSDVWLEHLSELEIFGYRNKKLELELLEFILARSPNLKKVIFRYSWLCGSRKNLKMLRNLFRPPLASPVKFVFVWN